MITEDLDLFFDDFGVSFVAGAVSGKCIKDQPGITIIGNQVIQVDYQVIAKTSQFGGLLYGDAVSVNGEPFVVREAMPVEDGAFSLISLEKITAVPSRFTTLAGDALVTLDGRYLVTR